MLLPGGFLCLAALGLVWGSPQPEGGSRIPLGGSQHDHSEGFTYDHEAFLGPDQARSFEELSPEESQRRLGLLVGRIDSDGDGAVSGPELRGWMERTRRRWREESAERGLRSRDRDGDGVVTWEEYRDEAYGPPEAAGGGSQPPLSRERRRFVAADTDGDGAADAAEFAAFLHPEDFEHMRPLVVTETMEEMDKDGDGFIQLEEYIAELFPEGAPAPPPPRLQQEREQFRAGRDLNRDGRLDRGELELWLSPPSPDWAGLEAAHLLHHSDRDKDGQLTKEEILGNWEMFVGSQATNYGEDLVRPHDEL